MAKKRTPAQEAERCAVDLQLLVRMKAADDHGYCACVTCGKVEHYKNMQGGHFIPRGNSATKLLEENIHPQCPYCNNWGMKSGVAAQQYTIYMIDTYGKDYVDGLLETKGKPFKWNRSVIADLHKHVKEQLKIQRARLGV